MLPTADREIFIDEEVRYIRSAVSFVSSVCVYVYVCLWGAKFSRKKIHSSLKLSRQCPFMFLPNFAESIKFRMQTHGPNCLHRCPNRQCRSRGCYVARSAAAPTSIKCRQTNGTRSWLIRYSAYRRPWTMLANEGDFPGKWSHRIETRTPSIEEFVHRTLTPIGSIKIYNKYFNGEKLHHNYPVSRRGLKDTHLLSQTPSVRFYYKWIVQEISG